MQIRARPYGPGSRVRVKNVHGGYRLPDGLPEGAEVVVKAEEPGWRTVEWDGREWGVPMACIDPGWIRVGP